MRKHLMLLLLVVPLVLSAQKTFTVKEYIETYQDIAMREMRIYKIPASITLAQGILESRFGNSLLAREANNHFGVKCHKDWKGQGIYVDDDLKGECFRVYDNPEESYRDHSEFLLQKRYAGLFQLDIMDYEGWARGLKAAGYATDPKYAEKLISNIQCYHLQMYDSLVMGLISKKQFDKEFKAQEKELDELQDLIEIPFSPLDRKVFEIVDMTENKRFIYENNHVRFIFAKEGETLEKLAQETGVKLKKLCKYNLITKPDEVVFHSGDVVYLEKLRNRNWKAKRYVVGENETVRDVALHFAVKPEKIRKMNKLEEGTRLTKGQKLRLR